jgi:hypothetical protein
MLLVSQAMQMLCVRSQYGEIVLRVLRKGERMLLQLGEKGKEVLESWKPPLVELREVRVAEEGSFP